MPLRFDQYVRRPPCFCHTAEMACLYYSTESESESESESEESESSESESEC